MKIFKFLLMTAFFAVLTGSLNAQDLSEIFDLYKNGVKAYQDAQYPQAISGIEQALKMVTAVEDDEQALALKTDCEKIIPQLYLSYAKQQLKAKEYAEAIQNLQKAKEVAEKYADDDVQITAEDLLPQVYTAKGTAEIEAGNMEEGIATYKKALELDKNNSTIYLRIALAQRAKDEAGAIATFDQIIAMGGAKSDDVATAKKQAATIYLKRAVAAQPEKKWSVMYENAQKAVGYDDSNMQAFRVIGQSAIELKKWKEAAEACETVLKTDTAAKDKNTIIYRLATAYESLNNKAKACSYYKQLTGDANYKAFAESKVKTLCQ